MKLKVVVFLSATLLILGFAPTGRDERPQISIAQNYIEHNFASTEPFSSPLRSNDIDKARLIAGSIMEIEKVESASVIIIGSSAIIGIELSEKLNKPDLSELKKRVEHKSLTVEPSVKSAAVTVNAELVERIKEKADSQLSS